MVASAPGKLVVLGEYAVLEGAPALVLAVDRRAEVSVQPAARATLSAPQLGLAALPLVHHDGVLSVGGAEAAKLSVVAAVFAAVADLGVRLDPVSLRIDTSAFYDQGGDKLGFGSSAAVAVALFYALCRSAGRLLSPAELFFAALRAHRAAQSGAGSGVDVAASTFGGLLAYVRDEVPELLPWPEGLGLAVVRVGQSTSTTDFVQRVKALGAADPARYRLRMNALVRLANTGLAAIRANDLNGLLAVGRDYLLALAALGEAAGVDIVSAPHAHVARLVESEGGVYKPSGAGGGDIGLVFYRGTEHLERLTRRVTADGFAVLPAPRALTGCRVS